MDWNKLLYQYFGYEKLNNDQEEILKSISNHQHHLILLPTGGGKSICFQLPVLAVNGKAVVISPLIALMEDQVATLKSKGIKATCIHSLMHPEEKRYILKNLHHFQFIYCSPEFALSPFGYQMLSKMPLTHFVIDEAHCISDWGFEFRADYLKLSLLINQFPNAQVLALTATANVFVQQDIINILKINMCIIDKSKKKPNVFLSTIEVDNINEKIQLLKEILKLSGPSIVYFSSKRICNEVAELLKENMNVATYHADMHYEERMKVQTQFLQDSIQIICATSAFGMGVDKKNIRTIIHFHVSKSPSQFIQEIGRAGRDGKQSQSIVLFEKQDYFTNLNLIEMSPKVEDLHLYNRGLLVDEEKREQIEKMLSMYTFENLHKRFESNHIKQIQHLDLMWRYLQSNHCLTHFLTQHLLNMSQNNQDDSSCKSMCNHCKSQNFLTFQTNYQKIQKIDKEKLINQLFNNH
ncbi:RecQ family ATP-dependent DNA helicase [Macrococcus sp. DPC7161]|uniref:RecQ family ATP-dependent DNA helicase n=1 Tax=Macrococcus sp. DPC7161 TaxID=2507060 RepID=UPI00100AC1BA|nr:RecQ family ATP-dependent DNA helicase [Macrococcus sp. DPC7161]RXK19294.1 ATP-dependent DNA helicase RecQ [Macrococcus sp. DPC7161]